MTVIKLRLGGLSAVLTVLTALALLIPAQLRAQESKIGVVDMERAIVQSTEGKKAETTFNAKFEALRKSIDKQQKDLEDAQNKLKLQERALSEAMKADLNKTITKLQTDIARSTEDAQRELDALRNELMKPIAEVAERLVSDFASEQGFTMIVDLSNPQNESVIWFNEKVDVTNELIRRINAALSAKAAPATTSPAPATPAPTTPAKKP